jgi:hypothetical protein
VGTNRRDDIERRRLLRYSTNSSFDDADHGVWGRRGPRITRAIGLHLPYAGNDRAGNIAQNTDCSFVQMNLLFGWDPWRG